MEVPMPKKLPKDWLSGKKRSLNVSTELGLKHVGVDNLFVCRYPPSKGSKLLWCRWLPLEEEDSRPFKGKTNGGKGKRKSFEGTTGCEDPYQAGKVAITWCAEQRKKLQQISEKELYQSEHSLHYYWNVYWAKLNDNPAKSARSKRDTLNRWNGKGWGISEQKWSLKSIDQVNALDLEEYFNLLDARGSKKKGSMSVQKEGQKTLLNHLNKIALIDFPLLQPFVYPTISRDKQEVEHFKEEEWEQLVNKVIELSGGAAKFMISEKAYQKLEWTDRSIFNTRNWVDLYDCLMLNWFFYLRPRDIPRLQSHWFKDQGDKTVRLFLEDTKQGRPKHETFHYRSDGYKFWTRMNRRRPKGYLAFPFYQRMSGEESASNVGATLNKMLQHAVDLCHIKKRKKVVWGIIRHTAFRLTLEDDPELGVPPNIFTFASNGHTSEKMLRETYLLAIDREKVAKGAQKKIKARSYSQVKRISLD